MGDPLMGARMRRRDALRAFLSLGAAAAPSCGLAQLQNAARPPVLGLLYPNPSSAMASAAIVARLKELGWIQGQNLLIEEASSEGNSDRLTALAAELMRKHVQVIWAAGPEAALAAARATRSIPIAFYGVGFPVEQGLVDSLARPGGNVTGLAAFAGSEGGKGLEILREIVPTAKRLAIVTTASAVATVAGGEYRVPGDRLESTAAALGFETQTFAVSRREDFEAAFAKILEMRAHAVRFDHTGLTFRERQRIADFASGSRLPSVGGVREFVEAGGLLAYGANRTWMVMRSFDHVDKLLRGARPAEVPVELPSKFELTLNRRAAKALGVTIPQTVLLRADEVVQ
jgi:putative tryptophan/tyrosine transport system substrate-binding protein